MNDRMRKGCCRLLTLLLTLVLVIPAYGQETLDALADMENTEHQCFK